MSISRLISIVFVTAYLVLGVSSPVGAQRSSPTCASCLVVDETGRALWSRRPDVPLPMASATKMVTALVTIESATLEDQVRVSPEAAATPGGKLSLVAGESLTVRELLAALLLNSSNDAAVVLAQHVSGDSDAFVRRMNQLADRLGAESAHFANPHGLDAEGHEASARDLATIGASVLEQPVLAEIVATQEMVIESSVRSAKLENTNLLLRDYDGAIGIKTGFTAGAGNVLVAAAERDGRTLIAVAMNSDDAFQDAAGLLDRGFTVLARTVLVARDTPISEIITADGRSVSVLAGGRFRGSYLASGISTEFIAARGVSLPLSYRQVVGEVQVYERGVPVGSVPAVAAAAADAQDPGWVESSLLALLSLAGEVHSAMGFR